MKKKTLDFVLKMVDKVKWPLTILLGMLIAQRDKKSKIAVKKGDVTVGWDREKAVQKSFPPRDDKKMLSSDKNNHTKKEK